MENSELIKLQACVIARKLHISLEEAQKMKADALKPPKKAEKETKIKESDDVKTNS